MYLFPCGYVKIRLKENIEAKIAEHFEFKSQNQFLLLHILSS